MKKQLLFNETFQIKKVYEIVMINFHSTQVKFVCNTALAVFLIFSHIPTTVLEKIIFLAHFNCKNVMFKILCERNLPRRISNLQQLHQSSKNLGTLRALVIELNMIFFILSKGYLQQINFKNTKIRTC